ncbi:MAG: hypothetical protein ACHP6I_03245 [Rickettsiales bacterium]
MLDDEMNKKPEENDDKDNFYDAQEGDLEQEEEELEQEEKEKEEEEAVTEEDKQEDKKVERTHEAIEKEMLALAKGNNTDRVTLMKNKADELAGIEGEYRIGDELAGILYRDSNYAGAVKELKDKNMVGLIIPGAGIIGLFSENRIENLWNDKKDATHEEFYALLKNVRFTTDAEKIWLNNFVKNTLKTDDERRNFVNKVVGEAAGGKNGAAVIVAVLEVMVKSPSSSIDNINELLTKLNAEKVKDLKGRTAPVIVEINKLYAEVIHHLMLNCKDEKALIAIIKVLDVKEFKLTPEQEKSLDKKLSQPGFEEARKKALKKGLIPLKVTYSLLSGYSIEGKPAKDAKSEVVIAYLANRSGIQERELKALKKFIANYPGDIVQAVNGGVNEKFVCQVCLNKLANAIVGNSTYTWTDADKSALTHKATSAAMVEAVINKLDPAKHSEQIVEIVKVAFPAGERRLHDRKIFATNNIEVVRKIMVADDGNRTLTIRLLTEGYFSGPVTSFVMRELEKEGKAKLVINQLGLAILAGSITIQDACSYGFQPELLTTVDALTRVNALTTVNALTACLEKDKTAIASTVIEIHTPGSWYGKNIKKQTLLELVVQYHQSGSLEALLQNTTEALKTANPVEKINIANAIIAAMEKCKNKGQMMQMQAVLVTIDCTISDKLTKKLKEGKELNGKDDYKEVYEALLKGGQIPTKARLGYVLDSHGELGKFFKEHKRFFSKDNAEQLAANIDALKALINHKKDKINDKDVKPFTTEELAYLDKMVAKNKEFEAVGRAVSEYKEAVAVVASAEAAQMKIAKEVQQGMKKKIDELKDKDEYKELNKDKQRQYIVDQLYEGVVAKLGMEENAGIDVKMFKMKQGAVKIDGKDVSVNMKADTLKNAINQAIDAKGNWVFGPSKEQKQTEIIAKALKDVQAGAAR